MHDDKVIEQLGGYAAVADALATLHPGHSFKYETVYVWQYRRRIPAKWRYSVAQIAKKRIRGFNADQFMRGEVAA